MKKSKEDKSFVVNSAIIFLVTSLVFGRLLQLNTFFCVTISFVLTIIFEVFRENRDKNKAAKRGHIYVTSSEKEKIRERQLQKFKYQKELYYETAKERYSVNFNTINSFLNIAEELGKAEIREGLEAQKTTVGKNDWAYAGGFASGVAGEAVGVAVALDTIKKNAEETQKLHKRDRQAVKHGEETISMANYYKKELSSQDYDGFIVSKIMPELLKNIKLSASNIKDYGTGFVEIDVKAITYKSFTFPSSSNKAKIDGSIIINLTDDSEEKIWGRGYYSAPGRFGNDKKKNGIGRNTEIINVIIQLTDNCFNANNGYKITADKSKLWLLELN